MEEALHDKPVFRDLSKVSVGVMLLPDETPILKFRHLLERHDLAMDMLRVVGDILQAKSLVMKRGPLVDAALITAPSLTSSADGE